MGRDLPTPERRWLILAGGGIILSGLLCLGLLAMLSRPGGYLGKPILTVTPLTWTPGPTSTMPPTNTPYAPTSTPTYVGPPPLWMSLEATYTPTPLYVNTPHPINEAFRTALRAYQDGDLIGFLRYMKQAALVEPSSTDAHYYVAEAYRLLDEHESALTEYEKAIAADRAFAPAYLGRARSLLALNPATDARADLDQAIELDPLLAEARMERALFFIMRDEPEHALTDLEFAGGLLLDSPLVYFYRAIAYLKLGAYNDAIESAQHAHDLDYTLLPAYLALGDAYFRTGDYTQAIHFLQTYTLYENESPEGWLLLGRALFESEQDPTATLDSLSRAIELDESNFFAYLYRGSTHLGLDQGQLALNDFLIATKLDPSSFDASLGLSQALLLSGRLDEALRQLNASANLVESDAQLAAIHFWRAQILEASGKLSDAVKDWQALLALPPGSASEAWIAHARDRMSVLLVTPGPGTAQPTAHP